MNSRFIVTTSNTCMHPTHVHDRPIRPMSPDSRYSQPERPASAIRKQCTCQIRTTASNHVIPSLSTKTSSSSTSSGTSDVRRQHEQSRFHRLVTRAKICATVGRSLGHPPRDDTPRRAPFATLAAAPRRAPDVPVPLPVRLRPADLSTAASRQYCYPHTSLIHHDEYSPRNQPLARAPTYACGRAAPTPTTSFRRVPFLASATTIRPSRINPAKGTHPNLSFRYSLLHPSA